MKILIMTGMEGVAGVTNVDDYCQPTSRYQEVGRELTTLEANAAIGGALEAGADVPVALSGVCEAGAPAVDHGPMAEPAQQ